MSINNDLIMSTHYYVHAPQMREMENKVKRAEALHVEITAIPGMLLTTSAIIRNTLFLEHRFCMNNKLSGAFPDIKNVSKEKLGSPTQFGISLRSDILFGVPRRCFCIWLRG